MQNALHARLSSFGLATPRAICSVARRCAQPGTVWTCWQALLCIIQCAMKQSSGRAAKLAAAAPMGRGAIRYIATLAADVSG